MHATTASVVRRKFSWGEVSFSGVWCHFYWCALFVTSSFEVTFTFLIATLWRSLRWSAIADKIKTIILEKVNYRGTHS